MSRRYSEQVEVKLGEPVLGMPHTPVLSPSAIVPTAFIWRGRHHMVREVLEHWTQMLPWWRDAWVEGDGSGGGAAGPETATATRPVIEQEVWRVEASAGRAGGTGVYELTSQGRQQWRLVRVAD